MRLFTPKFPDNKNDNGGYGLFISSNGKFHHVLDVQIVAKQSSILPTPKNFKKKQKGGYKYYQNYEMSVYVKPPSSVVYKTHKHTSHIGKTGAISYKAPKSLSDSLFQPYISWHGGKDVYDNKGLIAMKGFDLNSKQAYELNEQPTLGKGNIAAQYYMFANVVLPLDLSSFPSVSKKILSDAVIIEKMDDSFTDSKRVEGFNNLVLDVEDKFEGGICAYLFIHGLGLLHASRFDDREKKLWKTKPITLNPNYDAPLGVSLVFMDDGGVVDKNICDAIFIANSAVSNTDMAFGIRQTSFLENILIHVSRFKNRLLD